MTMPNHPPQNPQVTTPKENGPDPDAPPAYTPRRIPDLATYITQSMSALRYHHLAPQVGAQLLAVDSTDDDSEQTDPESSTPINLRINASINVNRNNNVVCLDTTPAENANSIAQAVVKAMMEGSAGRCGIPMIDENGAPRPLRIEVDAGMVIEGEGNIVGSRQAVSDILRRQPLPLSLRRRREDDIEDQDQEHQLAKRRRSSQ
ncbi:hypothetical protein BGZ63DRAFT_420696 [Mariannaea sp. PMI_226]|nr:hypothetical protein BGZ63DRAFT_420696 [Mariannaea sp. PMI_226]